MVNYVEGCTVFCDMDGVIVNFLGGAEKLLGRPWNSFKGKDRDERNRIVFERPGFWENLEPLPGWENLWKSIEHNNPHLLTAVPRGEGDRESSPYATLLANEGKWIWVSKHLGIPRERFHCVMRDQKQLYATKDFGGTVVSNILIDDTSENIVEWIDNRGVAVLHTSVPDTLSKLSEIGVVGV